MNQWLPVIATLSGAVVAGTISILVSLISNSFAKSNNRIALQEERANWAAERRLDSLQKLYGNLERLLESVKMLRIQQAWEASKDKDGIDAPPWVPSFNDAYEKWERALDEIISETLLIEEGVNKEFEDARQQGYEWFIASDKDKGVAALNHLEIDLAEFRRRIAEKYRIAFDERRTGADIKG